EHLAVDLDVGAPQARHERAVAHAQLAHRRVDARDPERAEFALFLPAVTVGVLPGLHDRLLGDAIDAAPAAAESLRLLQDLLVARACSRASLGSRHGGSLRRVRQHGAHGARIAVVDVGGAAKLALALRALLGED